jgi:hypothetical protein
MLDVTIPEPDLLPIDQLQLVVKVIVGFSCLLSTKKLTVPNLLVSLSRQGK